MEVFRAPYIVTLKTYFQAKSPNKEVKLMQYFERIHPPHTTFTMCQRTFIA